jgi:O-antigen/teichoic acid export membrane protein
VSIGRHIARGAAWMVAMRWLMRGIGLVNTVVVARILKPDDYGVMAMSAVVVELLMMLGDTNVDIALMREPGEHRPLYDSAWTVQVLFGVFAAGIVVAAAPLLAAYYRDPRVTHVLYILAARPLILGFENVGVVEFRKSFDFAKEFRYSIFRRLSLFAFSLALALTLRSYFALAIAAPISAAVAVAFSFGMSRYRPKPCFSHIGAVWSASKWLILQNVSGAALDRADEFVIGGVATSIDVGYYFVADQVAPMPTRELAWPMERALMPAYARIADDRPALRAHVLNVMGVMGMVCIAAGVGIMLVADDLVVSVFGGNWRGAVPFFRWLAIFGVFAALGRPLMPLFYMLKREKLYATLSFAQVVTTFAAVVFAALHFNLVAVAAARTLVAGCFCVIFAAFATRIAPLRLIDFAGALWRPCLAAAAMSLAVRALQTIPAPFAIVGLFRDAGVGALVFAATAWLSWRACGRPEGAERVILSAVRDTLTRRAQPVAV